MASLAMSKHEELTIQDDSEPLSEPLEPGVPADAIPAEEYMYLPPRNDPSSLEMRWQSKEFIALLARALSNRVFKEINGKDYLVRVRSAGKPLLTDEGATNIINLITSHVNPVVSLSNISDQDARDNWGYAMRAVQKSLVVYNEDYFTESNKPNYRLVMSMITTITFNQSMRAVKGHESHLSRTNLIEQRQENVSTQTMRNAGGFKLFGGNKNG